MTPDERNALIDSNTPEIEHIHDARAYFSWSWKGCGFGQLSFDLEDGKWECDTEFMSPERTRKLLHAYADHIADQLTPIIIEEKRIMDEKRGY